MNQTYKNVSLSQVLLRILVLLIRCRDAEQWKSLLLRTLRRKKDFSEKLLKGTRSCIFIPTRTTGFCLSIACLTLSVLTISLERTSTNQAIVVQIRKDRLLQSRKDDWLLVSLLLTH